MIECNFEFLHEAEDNFRKIAMNITEVGFILFLSISLIVCWVLLINAYCLHHLKSEAVKLKSRNWIGMNL